MQTFYRNERAKQLMEGIRQQLLCRFTADECIYNKLSGITVHTPVHVCNRQSTAQMPQRNEGPWHFIEAL